MQVSLNKSWTYPYQGRCLVATGSQIPCLKSLSDPVAELDAKIGTLVHDVPFQCRTRPPVLGIAPIQLTAHTSVVASEKTENSWPNYSRERFDGDQLLPL